MKHQFKQDCIKQALKQLKKRYGEDNVTIKKMATYEKVVIKTEQWRQLLYEVKKKKVPHKRVIHSEQIQSITIKKDNIDLL